MHSTFLEAAAGGALFGGAAGLLLLSTGRIAGVAGITAGLVRPKQSEILWRASFVAGLLAGGCAGAALLPDSFAWHREASALRVIVAGLLIGFGARLGNGCTSGHGICGVGRLSLRSVVAVALFTTAGFVTHLVDRLAGSARP